MDAFAYICLMDRRFLIISLWEQLDAFDKWLFIKINGQWTNPVFDTVFPFLRTPEFWVPLYLFLLVFITLNFGKKGVYWSIAFICTVALTDMIGARVLKDSVQRLRPCQDPFFAPHVRLLLAQCSGSYSFVSNHAANHFGIATFMFLTFRGLFKKWILIVFVWAFLISYAQVYVGVHYPLDVVGGAVLGLLAGLLTSWVFHKRWGSFNLDNILA